MTISPSDFIDNPEAEIQALIEQGVDVKSDSALLAACRSSNDFRTDPNTVLINKIMQLSKHLDLRRHLDPRSRLNKYTPYMKQDI